MGKHHTLPVPPQESSSRLPFQSGEDSFKLQTPSRTDLKQRTAQNPNKNNAVGTLNLRKAAQKYSNDRAGRTSPSPNFMRLTKSFINSINDAREDAPNTSSSSAIRKVRGASISF